MSGAGSEIGCFGRFVIGLALTVVVAVLTILVFWQSLVTLFSDFSEDDVRSYVRKYIESKPEWIGKKAEAVIQDVKIEKMKLHDQDLFVAKVPLRVRGDFETWGTLYLVCSPDHSGYLISGNKYLLNEVDEDGYAKVAQDINAEQHQPTPTPTPTSTVIYHEFPAPTKAP